jgi:hypothetical protein
MAANPREHRSVDRRTSARRLRWLVRACAAALACFLAAGVVAGCGGTSTPTGTYTTKVPEPHTPLGKLEGGTWTLKIAKNGKYSIQQGVEIGLGVGKGSYVKGDTFVINPLAPNTCGPGPGTGVYKLKLSGNTLTFVRVKDPCSVRRDILSYPFTKAG